MKCEMLRVLLNIASRAIVTHLPIALLAREE